MTELNEIRRFIRDQEAAGQPVEKIVLSRPAHDSICDELRQSSWSPSFCCHIERMTIETLFGLPVEII
jgi:hypothetical protein